MAIGNSFTGGGGNSWLSKKTTTPTTQTTATTQKPFGMSNLRWNTMSPSEQARYSQGATPIGTMWDSGNATTTNTAQVIVPAKETIAPVYGTMTAPPTSSIPNTVTPIFPEKETIAPVYDTKTAPPATTTPIGAPLWDAQTAAALGQDTADATKGVLNSTLDGSIYNAHAIAQQEAQARAEANRRAATAQQINAAGFGGTPIGAMLGNATEADLLRGRFDNELGIAQARNEMMLQGANTAQQWADNANRFGETQRQFDASHGLDTRRLDESARQFDASHGLDERRLALTESETDADRAQKDWAFDLAKKDAYAQDLNTWMTMNPQTVDAVMSGNMDALLNDPAAMTVMENYLRSQGVTGDIAPEMIMNTVANQHAATSAAANLRRELKQYFPDYSDEEINALTNETVLKALGFEWKEVDGKMQLTPIDEIEEEKAKVEDKENRAGAKSIVSGETKITKIDFPDGKDDERYKIALDNAIEGAGNVATRDSGRGYYPQLDKAWNSGKANIPVNIDGTLYYVTERKQVGYVIPGNNVHAAAGGQNRTRTTVWNTR